MSIVSRLAGWWRAKSTTKNPEQWFIDWIRGGQEASSGVVVSNMRAMRDVTWMSGISIRSLDLAKCPVHVYRRMDNGGQTIIADHPLEKLLRKPNDWQDRLEFIEQMQAVLLSKGNSFAAIKRDGRNRPIAMIPVEYAEVRTAGDGSLYYWVTETNEHQRAVLSGFPNPIPASDMLHLRWLSFDGLCGLSRLSLSRDALGLSLALEEHSARLFANGARPSGVWETDKRLSDPVFERFKTQLEEFRGVGNTGKTPILEEGLKWRPQTMTSVESQTIEARRLQIEQIAMALDIPMHRLGIIPEGGGQAIAQAHQMYLNNTLSGDAERWEAKLADKFGLDGVNEFVAFDLDYFNRADIQTRMNAYRTGVVGMVMMPNEARRREGWAAHPQGDELYQPTNVAPIGFMPKGSESGPGSDVTGAPAPGGDGDPAAVDPVGN